MQHLVGDLYEDNRFGDYLLCVLTLEGKEQLISTPRQNLQKGILSFYMNLGRITSFENPLESNALEKIGHIEADLTGKLRKRDILVELPEEFEKIYSLENSKG